MKRYLLQIILSLTVIIILLNLIFSLWMMGRVEATPQDFSPYDGSLKLQGFIYSLRDYKLYPHSYKMNINRFYLYDHIARQYEELAQEGKEGYFTNLKILEITEDREMLFVDISPQSFQAPHVTEKNIHMYMMALVNSLTEYRRNLKVQFLIQGSTINHKIMGLDMSQPFTRDEVIVHKDPEFLFQILKKTLDEAVRENYLESFQNFYFGEQYTNITRFTDQMKAYLKDFPLSNIDHFTAEQVQGGYQILLKYRNVENFVVWKLIYNDKLLQVDYESCPLKKS